MKNYITTVTLLLAIEASAQETIAGLAIGDAINVPECPSTSSYGITTYDYSDHSSKPCYRLETPGDSIGNDHQRLIFDLGEMPAGFTRQAVGDLVERRLEALSLGTFGSIGQQEVLDSLIEKYGQPASKSENNVQNRLGANFIAVTATWQRESIEVLFDGISGQINRGMVLVVTPRGKALLKELEEKRESESPKL